MDTASILFRRKYPVHMETGLHFLDASIHFIWTLVSVVFGSQYPFYFLYGFPFYLESSIQNSKILSSKLFGHLFPKNMYTTLIHLDAIFQNIWKRASNLIWTQISKMFFKGILALKTSPRRSPLHGGPIIGILA